MAIQRPLGLILYEGPSRLDPAVDIVVIATGLSRPTSNTKTGDMVQTWILRQDMSPSQAAYEPGELDGAICGSGEHRCAFALNADGKRGCYVRAAQAPRGVWEAWQRGRYAAWQGETYTGASPIRVGSYGDPVAVPLWVWQTWMERNSHRHTGYTHQWRQPEAHPYRTLLMASVESREDFELAESMGWRAFYVREKGSPIDVRAISCPASAERGHVLTCAECLACSGSNAMTLKRRSVTIEQHR